MKRLSVIFIAVLAIIVVAGLLVVQFFGQPYKGYAGDEIFVDVPPGSGVGAIGRRLVEAGVVRNEAGFRLAMRLHGGDRTLKAGEYRFSGALRPAEVIDKIARGEVYLRPITIPEGLTIAEMAEIVAAHDLGTKAAFVRAARNAELVRNVDPAADDLEGYLFPETYALPRNDTSASLVEQMAKRFLEVYDEGLRREAAARGLRTRAVVTLASLIEKETSRPEERPIVSAVYQNRLRIGMPLQCDPTTIYALQRAGQWNGNLTKANLQFDSPYNTYRYPGLPPGPIAAPGRASLEAAIRPAAVKYLYFVSRNDGSHVFSETLDEHNRNVRQFQQQYFRDKRAADRAAAPPGR
jgi:UPF0755 protein